MNHICILIWIIVSVGAIAGLTNFLYYYFKGLISNPYELVKYIFSGVGASILVPLLLNMLSSSLIQYVDGYNPINYFVFAGFCFVAGYFSDRFINTVGERILNDLEKTNKKVEEVISNAKQNEEKLDILVSAESDIDETGDKAYIDLSKFKEHSKFADDDLKTQINKITKSFDGKYKFRTTRGIAKELEYTELVTETILKGLQGQGLLKLMIDKDRHSLWTLTQMGKMFVQGIKE